MEKKAFLDFESQQEATMQAVIRAINRSSLSQIQRKEFCMLLDEELDQEKIVAKEVTGADSEANSFAFDEFEDKNNGLIVKALIFTRDKKSKRK